MSETRLSLGMDEDGSHGEDGEFMFVLIDRSPEQLAADLEVTPRELELVLKVQSVWRGSHSRRHSVLHQAFLRGYTWNSRKDKAAAAMAEVAAAAVAAANAEKFTNLLNSMHLYLGDVQIRMANLLAVISAIAARKDATKALAVAGNLDASICAYAAAREAKARATYTIKHCKGAKKEAKDAAGAAAAIAWMAAHAGISFEGFGANALPRRKAQCQALRIAKQALAALEHAAKAALKQYQNAKIQRSKLNSVKPRILGGARYSEEKWCVSHDQHVYFNMLNTASEKLHHKQFQEVAGMLQYLQDQAKAMGGKQAIQSKAAGAGTVREKELVYETAERFRLSTFADSLTFLKRLQYLERNPTRYNLNERLGLYNKTKRLMSDMRLWEEAHQEDQIVWTKHDVSNQYVRKMTSQQSSATLSCNMSSASLGLSQNYSSATLSSGPSVGGSGALSYIPSGTLSYMPSSALIDVNGEEQEPRPNSARARKKFGRHDSGLSRDSSFTQNVNGISTRGRGAGRSHVVNNAMLTSLPILYRGASHGSSQSALLQHSLPSRSTPQQAFGHHTEHQLPLFHVPRHRLANNKRMQHRYQRQRQQQHRHHQHQQQERHPDDHIEQYHRSQQQYAHDQQQLQQDVQSNLQPPPPSRKAAQVWRNDEIVNASILADRNSHAPALPTLDVPHNVTIADPVFHDANSRAHLSPPVSPRAIATAPAHLVIREGELQPPSPPRAQAGNQSPKSSTAPQAHEEGETSEQRAVPIKTWTTFSERKGSQEIDRDISIQYHISAGKGFTSEDASEEMQKLLQVRKEAIGRVMNRNAHNLPLAARAQYVKGLSLKMPTLQDIEEEVMKKEHQKRKLTRHRGRKFSCTSMGASAAAARTQPSRPDLPKYRTFPRGIEHTNPSL